MEQIKRNHPELLISVPNMPDPVRHAQVSADLKREMLSILWQEVGPKALLHVGQEIHSIEYDPIWYYACRSGAPRTLFDKWQRFEKFAHSTNRVEIGDVQGNSARFSRYRSDGGMPSDPENLLICGLMIALLEAIGCQGLECAMPLKTGEAFIIRSDEKYSLPLGAYDLVSPSDSGFPLDTRQWTIRWDKVEPQLQRSISVNETNSAFIIELPPITEKEDERQVEEIVRYLLKDVSRLWKIKDLAVEAGYSTRSLQRLFTNAGLNFSKLIRLVRIQVACRMLSQPTNNLTAIGFCVGFSDSAHFSRDFKASMGMSPRDYRKSLMDRDL